MAASTRALTPTHTGPFSAPNAPNSPSLLSANASKDLAPHPALNPQHTATFGAHLTKSPKGLSPTLSPQPLTGAAALADERRLREQERSRGTSPNPATAVVQQLAPTQNNMSRPKDVPSDTAQMNESVTKPAKPIMIPDQVTVENMQTSPVSISSFGSAESTSAPTTTTAMDATAGTVLSSMAAQEASHPQHQAIAPNPGDGPSNRAFTFPGPLSDHDPRAPARQMSLPGYPQNSPKSPSAKRHKCPYCSTDFTRHHNLKSHLLTHSQEKPYECPTCQARFRRLHDLKRHTKLHTGERPHTCDKCGRRFARGDALARHNKGQGGCAGRRSSYDDMADAKGEDMDGIVYHAEDGEERMDDDEQDREARRRVSEPARKRQNTGNSTQGPYHQHSSTYPPIAANRGQMGGNNTRPLYPPGANSSGSSRDQSTNLSSKIAPSLSSIHPYAANQSGVFAQGGMTESPKPISPGQAEHHRIGVSEGSLGGRSPNMTQLHPQNFARGAGRGSSPMGLHPHGNNSVPQLPLPPGLAPMPVHKNSQGGKGNGSSMLQQQISGGGSQPGSMSSHGASSGGSMRELMGNRVDENSVINFMREMESRMARMKEEHEQQISQLQEKVISLEAQLGQQHQQPSTQTQ